ncbi:hypothetical protein ABT024_28385 [Streptomyces sp. NPDC002812]|uniref:hypothetical protein n=1 Tax=Streptomyces sp. NPDC002812 TaxID=3154434 RepID=UPI00331F8577
MHRRLTSAIVIAAAALGGLAAPGTAHAADARCLWGMSATLTGALVVQASGSAPKPVVHVRDKKTGRRVATVSEFRRQEFDDSPAVEFVSEPLKLPALGIYGLEVGSEADHADCGDFDYRLRTAMGKLAARDKVSVDSLRTTVSADVTVFDPRTQTRSPLKNTKVSFSGEGISQEVSTDGQGRLDAPVSFRGTEKSTYLQFSIQATPERDDAGGGTVVPTVRRKAEIVLDPASEKIRAVYGSTATLTGRASVIAADGTRRPVPQGTPLNGDLDGVPGTGADGRFERKIRVAPRDDYPWADTTWANNSSYPWLTMASDRTDIDLVEATSFTKYTATVDAARRVTFTGTLTRKPGAGYADVEVQYSTDGKTDWKTRKTFRADSGSEFKQTLPGETDGYWRLHYPGTANIQAATTQPVRLTRTATNFSYFNAAPEPVRKGQTFTIKGTLQHGTPAKAYGGQTVQFYFRPAGSQDFLPQGQAKTAADGTFTHSFKADRTGTWIARYRDADGKHFNAESRQDDLAVNP